MRGAGPTPLAVGGRFRHALGGRGVPPGHASGRPFKLFQNEVQLRCSGSLRGVGFMHPDRTRKMIILLFYLALAPPSTTKAIPVTHSASGEVRNNTQWATSWGVPNRGQGVSCKAALCLCSPSEVVGRFSAVGIRPGQTALILIRCGPYMTAKLRVKFTTAAFEAL